MGTQNVPAVQEKEESIRTALERSAPKLQEVLPPGVTPERVIRMALVAASRNPDILKCTRDSVLVSVLQIASWGLEIGRTAHLVPYGKTCTALPDYKGLVQMAINTRSVQKVDARVVRKGDQFDVEYGLDEKCLHRPVIGSKEEVTAVYAIVALPNGERKFEVMSFEEVEEIRKRSRAGNSGPWKTDWTEMAKKTVVKRLLKMVPLSEKVADAIEADNHYERGDDQPEPTPVKPGASGTDKLKAKLNVKAQVDEEESEASESGAEAGEIPPIIRGLLKREAEGQPLSDEAKEELRQWRLDNPEGAGA